VKPLTPEIEYCRATVKAWERLRLLYNAILVVPGIMVLSRTIYLASNHGLGGLPPGVDGIVAGDALGFIALSFVFGFVANICYCVGPYAEFVIAALGFPISGERSRYLVFGLGVMLSLGVIGCAWLSVEYSAVSSLIPAP
jgi:hypothetical protein